jgi:hypothetical protein
MPKLVIAFHADGTVETLLKDKVFDTRVLGDRQIERLSEVLPTDDGQKFFIRWLKGPLAAIGRPKIPPQAQAANGFFSYGGFHCHYTGQVEYFDTYEEAVECEVSTVNALRLLGHSFK